MDSSAKWYIELPQGFFADFNTLAMAFLTNYQLLICYEIGTEILSSFKQTKATHISDHIHEWRQRRHLIKLELLDQLLIEWFTKSFVNDIDHEITMGGVVMEAHAISRAQYLDLVYSQTGTLYNLLPDVPHPCTSATSTTPTASHATDDVIGTFHAQPHFVQTSSNTPKPISSNVKNAPSPTPPTGKTSEVNAVQSTPTGKNKSRKERVRIRRKQIIRKKKEPKHHLLTIGISANPDTLVLFVVMITTLRIVHDEQRLLSSFKGP
jgi:hypothetical protein